MAAAAIPNSYSDIHFNNQRMCLIIDLGLDSLTEFSKLNDAKKMEKIKEIRSDVNFKDGDTIGVINKRSLQFNTMWVYTITISQSTINVTDYLIIPTTLRGNPLFYVEPTLLTPIKSIDFSIKQIHCTLKVNDHFVYAILYINSPHLLNVFYTVSSNSYHRAISKSFSLTTENVKDLIEKNLLYKSTLDNGKRRTNKNNTKRKERNRK